MKINAVLRKVVMVCVGFGLAWGGPLQAATWNGGGSDNSWTNGANWGGAAPASGEALSFAGTTRLVNTNDFTGYSFGGITFATGAGAFVLGGNAFTNTGNTAFWNQTANEQTINLAVVLGYNGENVFRTGGGPLVFNGPVLLNNNTLKPDLSSGRDITFNGGVQGAGNIEAALGNISMSGSNTFTVSILRVRGNNCVLDLGSSNAIVATSVYIEGAGAGGTLKISGGSLSQSGASERINIAWNPYDSGKLYVSGDASLTYDHLRVSQSGTGTVYQSGGIVRAINGTDGLAMNQNNSANGTYNLSGGELQANSWKPIVAGAVSTFNFSGGTIRPHTNNLTIKTALTLTGDNGSLNSTDSLGSGRTLTVSQPIGETGGAHNLMLAGTGTISLATNNVHSGVTTLAGGTLSIAHPMALQNSALDYTDGAVTFATGITAAQFGGLTGTGNLLLVNASSVGVALSVSNTATMTYGGVLSDNSKSGSLVKTGSGTLILSNASSYSGATTVNSGTLVVNGATTNSAITVASGAALCGVGSVGTVTISNNATLSAGNPSAVGSLTATNLTLAEGANVAWDYNAGSGDLVTVNGNINLPTNATVTVTGTGGLPASRVMFTGTLLGAMDLNWTFTGSGVKPNMRAVRSGNNVSLVIPTGFILNFY